MPSFDVIKQWQFDNTYRVASVKSQFDLRDANLQHHFIGILPLEEKSWVVGSIVGRSGTGKSSIARELFPEEYWV